MIRVHPQWKLVASLVALAYLSGVVGCKNQQTAVAGNPFMGPTRVPPPSTRALAPGQAQPYYQGDSLPVSQQNGGQPSAAPAVASTPEMPTADGNLAWSSPTGATTTSATRSASAPVTNPPPSSSAVASNEPTVAVPDDGNALRFAPPTTAAAEPRAFVPNDAVALASQPVQTAAPQQVSPPPSDVALASYSEPVITNTQQAVTSPWLTPQITPSGASPASAPPQQLAAPVGQPLVLNGPPSLPPYYAMPPVVATNTMEVRLREVPSPPMPRIRIPGESAVPTVSSADGFRPRTSMR